ncbi:hypothetical protein LWI28_017074 [Acer negundo]|uniref:Uncharacterized protein n=1 Tax=Acer negundo TaxID=4023 RepID=A0AAD5NNJ9_ACENE|nr:hypothetical protein LWI28_017074 [Acer negundo]
MSKKGKQYVAHVQTSTQIRDMEEDLQDSELLKIFHREVSQIIVLDFQSPSPGETTDNIIIEKDVDPTLLSSMHQIDISNADNFDVVASKLKEVNVDKEDSPHGLWLLSLLVSYEKHGNRNLKVKFGKNGNGSVNTTARNGSNGNVRNGSDGSTMSGSDGSTMK